MSNRKARHFLHTSVGAFVDVVARRKMVVGEFRLEDKRGEFFLGKDGSRWNRGLGRGLVVERGIDTEWHGADWLMGVWRGFDGGCNCEVSVHGKEKRGKKPGLSVVAGGGSSCV
jgi:hypothetical protein